MLQNFSNGVTPKSASKPSRGTEIWQFTACHWTSHQTWWIHQHCSPRSADQHAFNCNSTMDFFCELKRRRKMMELKPGL